jgi:sortase A
VFTLLVGSASLIILWVLVFALGLSALQEARQQRELYATTRYRLAQEITPLGGDIAPGTPIGVLSASRAGVHDTVIVEGTTATQLRAGPGHQRTTPLPGQVGDSVVFGRSVTFGGPFRHIDALRKGDAVTVVTGQGTFTYAVLDVRRAGDPEPVVAAAQSVLTLVSGKSSGWSASFASSQVIYVDALLQGKSVDTPPGRPVLLSKAEGLMQSDPSPLARFQLGLWVTWVALAVGAVVVLRRRWGRMQLWLVSTPVLLAGLWGASNALMQFLPNLL